MKTKNSISTDPNSIIDKVNYYQNKNAIDTLTRIIDSANRLGFILTIFLVFISIIITLNTIRLAIFMSKDEIAVMRLVGASSTYVKGPFIVSGALYGFTSAIITLFLFFPATYYLGNATESFFVGLNIFKYYISNFGEIFLIVVSSGVVVGSFSSFLAVRRHLKV